MIIVIIVAIIVVLCVGCLLFMLGANTVKDAINQSIGFDEDAN